MVIWQAKASKKGDFGDMSQLAPVLRLRANVAFCHQTRWEFFTSGCSDRATRNGDAMIDLPWKRLPNSAAGRMLRAKTLRKVRR
jgi:hypothetical protein